LIIPLYQKRGGKGCNTLFRFICDSITMLRQKAVLFHRVAMAGDALLIVGGFLISYWLRQGFLRGYFDDVPLFPLKEYLWGLILALPVWIGMLWRSEVYASLRTKGWAEITWAILWAGIVTTVVLGTVLFLLKIAYFSRTFVLLFFLSAVSTLLLERIVIFGLLKIVRRKGYNYRTMLVVGTGKVAQHFARLVRSHGEWGFRLIGFMDVEPTRVGHELLGVPVLGGLEKLPDVLHERIVDEVVFALPRRFLGHIEDSLKSCEEIGVRAHVLLDWYSMQIAKTKLGELHGMPLLTLTTTPVSEAKLLLKRAFDVIVSVLLLILLSPLFLIVSALIKLTSPGPVFFKQERCGLGGRRFKFYKFRSMNIDAEERKKGLEHLNEMSGPVFKIKDDPRITPVGRILRKFSIDELPQLINVLIGEMSLVGPRPPIPDEVQKYERWQKRRLSMRPGLTCLWQINGRNEVDFDQWMKLDLEYIDNWSLGLDFKILLKTIPVVLTGHGAH